MAMGWIAAPHYVKNKRTPNQIFEDKLLKKFQEEHKRQVKDHIDFKFTCIKVSYESLQTLVLKLA